MLPENSYFKVFYRGTYSTDIQKLGCFYLRRSHQRRAPQVNKSFFSFSSFSNYQILAYNAYFRLYQDHPGVPCDFPGNLASREIWLPGNLTSWEIWLPGKFDFLENLTSRKIQLPRNLTFWETRLPGNFTSQETGLPGKFDFPGNKWPHKLVYDGH